MMFALFAKVHVFFAAFGEACDLKKGDFNFFALPHWYEYLPGAEDALGKCSPNVKIPEGFWPIILALIEVLIRVAGFLAIIYIIIAGFTYITSQGNAERATAARTQILNALIGLVIAIVAATAVRFIGNRFVG